MIYFNIKIHNLGSLCSPSKNNRITFQLFEDMRLSFLLPFVIVIGLVELYFSQQSNNIDIVISVNENPYTLTFDSNKFTLLGLAESFCRGKASELGITTLDALLLNCIPPVSNALRVQISRKLDPSLIRQGELSAESRQYVEQSSATEAVASRGSEVVSAAQQTPSATLPTNFEVVRVTFHRKF